MKHTNFDYYRVGILHLTLRRKLNSVLYIDQLNCDILPHQLTHSVEPFLGVEFY